VEIGDVVSCTCITPMLLHLQCSHVMTACHKCCVLHEGSNYVTNVATRKLRKGRQKKKRFRNEMDDMEKDYDNDMYDFGDFDEVKNKVHCSIFHGEGHIVDRHKEGPKRNRRARGAIGRNRRSGATEIIEVTHTNIIEIIYFTACTNIICCICN
jgi:hypothetical protein